MSGKIKSLENIKKIVALVMCIAMATVIVVRSLCLTITFDEAYTYFDYVLNFKFSLKGLVDLYSNSNSNNHMLNTILIAIVDNITGVRYVEGLIRLPNVVASIIFFYTSYKMYIKKHINGIVFYIIITSFYVNEYFTLARGYGLAICFITLTLYLMLLWKERDYEGVLYPALIMLTYALACEANTISLLIAPALGLICISEIIRTKQLGKFLARFWYGIILTVGVVIAMLKYHIRVSEHVSNVKYDVTSTDFFGAFFANFGKMIVYEKASALFIGIIICLVAIINVVIFIIKKVKKIEAKAPVFTIVFLSLAVIIFAQGVINGGEYVTGRVMVPLFPCVAFVVQELMDNVNQEHLLSKIVVACISALLIIVSAFQLMLDDTHEFTNERSVKAYAYEHVYNNTEEYSGFFFTVEIFYEKQAQYLRSFSAQ